MSDEKPLSHEIRRSVTAEGLPLRQWADRAAALKAAEEGSQ